MLHSGTCCKTLPTAHGWVSRSDLRSLLERAPEAFGVWETSLPGIAATVGCPLGKHFSPTLLSSSDSEQASALLPVSQSFKGASPQPQPQGCLLVGPSQSWVPKPLVGDGCRYGDMAYFWSIRQEGKLAVGGLLGGFFFPLKGDQMERWPLPALGPFFA